MALEITQGSHLLLKFDRKEISILKTEILYIKSDDDYIKIHLADGKYILAHMKLKIIEKVLADDFVRVHRSYIVSLLKINLVKKNIIHIGTVMVPVGKIFSKQFLLKYKIE